MNSFHRIFFLFGIVLFLFAFLCRNWDKQKEEAAAATHETCKVSKRVSETIFESKKDSLSVAHFRYHWIMCRGVACWFVAVRREFNLIFRCFNLPISLTSFISTLQFLNYAKPCRTVSKQKATERCRTRKNFRGEIARDAFYHRLAHKKSEANYMHCVWPCVLSVLSQGNWTLVSTQKPFRGARGVYSKKELITASS